LGYIAVSAELRAAELKLEGLQPGPNLKRRKYEKKGSV